MNKNKLKSYAPAARRDFIQAVSDRANVYGLSEKGAVPVEESGDVAIIGGRPFPRRVAAQRRNLEARVKREGFGQVMEAVAYTWFNRFLALRYMELHGYLDHGFRVLSNSGSGTIPEILEHATELDLPGLNKQQVIELKLDGSKDAELYRLLLVAQCNALHAAMPFLFEKIDDETELLLPDNLLHSDSLIRKLVNEIEEQDWQDVEIIGWLYQFYISEKKDQVIGKVVKSEDIPAATQLFTPNWIVKYMVQNSLGRQWLATYPASPLKAKMEYYIEPAEQTEEVKAQLAAITPDSLDPEKLTLLDPACGSGHILVEAYDVFREIYLERGYSNRDFPRLILEKNLFGLDIDDRAAQMAGFALLMKARKDDRRILRSDDPVKLNVMAIQESGVISVENAHWDEQAETIRELADLFSFGKTFGSLIQIPRRLAIKLPVLEEKLEQTLSSGDLYASQSARDLITLVKQAKVMAGLYDCVVANPPYMGSGYLNEQLKVMLKEKYVGFEVDLFAAFILRNLVFTKDNGNLGFMTPYVWMYIGTYDGFRKYLIEKSTINTLVQLEYSGFSEATVPICSFTIQRQHILNFTGSYIKLSDFKGPDVQSIRTKEAINNIKCGWYYKSKPDDFLKIPGHPISFWATAGIYKTFGNAKIDSIIVTEGQNKTSNNEKYLKLHWEVPSPSVGPQCKWLLCAKGGSFRKWYGNLDYVIDWSDETRKFYRKNLCARIIDEKYWYRKGITWTDITSSTTAFRYLPNGATFETAGPTFFLNDENELEVVLGLLNSKYSIEVIKILNSTFHVKVKDVKNIPIPLNVDKNKIKELISCAVKIAHDDWDSFETSRDFKLLPLLKNLIKTSTTEGSWQNWLNHCTSQIEKMKEIETANNRHFIEAFNLTEELTPDVPDEQITLARADREADMKRLVSFSIACMMGRYSLDQPGLVYASNGNINFDQSKYQTFSADDDGIVPVMDMDWFPDDAASRFEEFLKVAWSPETLEENFKFVADSLTPKANETPRETIRRYISTQFFKDHLQSYKKRPIYWLFSSGKQRAFECLVYLHRYNEATLSRMRNEYVTPLQGKFTAQADYLANEVGSASSTAERNRLQKQLDTLKKKQTELAAFDDLLRHYADQRISLDLDDGVKVNYGKFGSLLAEVKAVTGGGE